MAYLVELTRHRCPCGKRATVRLFNSYNAPCGEFCRRCGERNRREMDERVADRARRLGAPIGGRSA